MIYGAVGAVLDFFWGESWVINIICAVQIEVNPPGPLPYNIRVKPDVRKLVGQQWNFQENGGKMILV